MVSSCGSLHVVYQRAFEHSLLALHREMNHWGTDRDANPMIRRNRIPKGHAMAAMLTQLTPTDWNEAHFASTSLAPTSLPPSRPSLPMIPSPFTSSFTMIPPSFNTSATSETVNSYSGYGHHRDTDQTVDSSVESKGIRHQPY